MVKRIWYLLCLCVSVCLYVMGFWHLLLSEGANKSLSAVYPGISLPTIPLPVSSLDPLFLLVLFTSRFREPHVQEAS